jgi:hypothetical protein
LLRELDLVDDLSIAGIGLGDTQRKIVLLFGADSATKDHYILIDINTPLCCSGVQAPNSNAAQFAAALLRESTAWAAELAGPAAFAPLEPVPGKT